MSEKRILLKSLSFILKFRQKIDLFNYSEPNSVAIRLEKISFKSPLISTSNDGLRF